MQDTDLPVVAVARSRGPARVLEAILDGVAGTLLFIMMMVTTVDVVGRYFFHSPLHGAYEGNELLLGVLDFTVRMRWMGRQTKRTTRAERLAKRSESSVPW